MLLRKTPLNFNSPNEPEIYLKGAIIFREKQMPRFVIVTLAVALLALPLYATAVAGYNNSAYQLASLSQR